jgi:hypothetical protein
MSDERAPEAPSTGKKVLFFSIIYLSIAGFAFLGAEVIARTQGVTAWELAAVEVAVEPGDRFFAKHPSLGYTHIPGEFAVTLRNVHTFKVTHLDNTLRVTQPLAAYDNQPSREEIWIFGCSFTHGWALNDEETYPWLVQQEFPQFEIINFGVSGYGTLHSFIQFREALEAGRRPRLAIATYAAFHDSRNTFLRSRQKNISAWNKLGPLVQPYARVDEAGELTFDIADVEYIEFPLMRHSAFMHFLERKYNDYEARKHRSQEVSKAIIKEMSALAAEKGVDFVLANIGKHGTAAVLEFAREEEIEVVDISLDLKGRRHRYDVQHPSADANREYADMLTGFLTERFARSERRAIGPSTPNRPGSP